jgi:ABC-2 type transport system permease protein
MIDTLAQSPVDAKPALTIGFDNLLRSEWTKLRSLRSMILCAGLIVIAMLGIAIILGIRWSRQDGAMPDDFDPALISLSGVYLAQIVAGAVGVLTISSEFTTGMIRASFSAVPQRQAVLAAKALVLAAAMLVLGEIISFTSFTLGQALLADKHAGASLTDPGVLRAVVGAGLYLPAVALLGFGLGAVVRHTAGALSSFFAILFAPSALVDLLPDSWRNAIIEYLPANAGSQIFTVIHTKDALAPWTGLGVFCLYAAAAVGAGMLLVVRRDA